MNKKELAIVLSKTKENPEPKIWLEQYTIPSELAAEIINIAYLNGDIEKKIVFDFGCGTGRLAIGASLMGAKKVIGIDIDKQLIKIARENVKLVERLIGKRLTNIKFMCKDVARWRMKGDTVVQNPPFGIKSSGLDLLFLRKAIESAKKVYSLHRGPEARKFLIKFIESVGGEVEAIHKFKFEIPYMFKFHKKPKVKIDVDLYVIRGSHEA